MRIKIQLKAVCQVILGVMVVTNSFGQILVSDKEMLDFGDTFENAPDSLSFTISNLSAISVQFKTIRKFKIYGKNDFSIKDTSFSLASGASKQVFVKFSPRHNITYLSQLVIEDDAQRGNLVIELKGNGKYSKTYYNGTQNLSEEALKSALKTIITQNYVTLGYNGGRDKMFMLVDNLKVNGQGAAVNTIIDRYVGKTISGFTTRSGAQNFPDGNCTSVCFNTEHTWPQSLFSQNDPMVSDLHHLFVVHEPANSTRSNYPFGVVPAPTWTSGGSKFANGVFEPRDDQKGATARSMLYFPIRHQNYGNFLNSQESILRQWHVSYPPDQRDIRRNDDIFDAQKNRNPFVDYPQFIERITSVSSTSNLAPIYKIDTVGNQVSFGILSDTAFRTFNYPIINNGNQTLTLTGISLKVGNSVELLPIYLPSLIPPGGKVLVKIRVKCPQSPNLFFDSLFYTYKGSFNHNVSIGVSGNVQFPVVSEYDLEIINASPKIIPNPSNGKFLVEMGGDFNASIYDLFGNKLKVLISKEVTGCQIDMTDHKPGVYVLSITKYWNNYIFKIVIN